MVLVALTMNACSSENEDKNISQRKQEASEMINPVFHFEIPVSDMNRAKEFYEGVFG